MRAGVRPRVGEKYPFNFELDFGRFWSTDEEIDTLIPIRNKSLPGVPINGKITIVGTGLCCSFQPRKLQHFEVRHYLALPPLPGGFCFPLLRCKPFY